MSYKITAIIPQLPCQDIESTKSFYLNKLGCKLLNEYPDFLLIEFEGIEIHFWLCDDKSIAEMSSCYIRVENIEILHKKLSLQFNSLSVVQRRDWGQKEFYIIDNSGNLLKFGEPI